MKPDVLFAAIAALVAFTAPASAQEQIKGQFSYEAIADCERPKIKNYTIKGEGVATLSADKSATLRMRSGLSGYTRYNVKLGEKTADDKGNAMQLRVTGNHSLRATREYPNSIITAELRFVGQACNITLRHRLKPGKKVYLLPTPLGEAICTNVRISKATCKAL